MLGSGTPTAVGDARSLGGHTANRVSPSAGRAASRGVARSPRQVAGASTPSGCTQRAELGERGHGSTVLGPLLRPSDQLGAEGHRDPVTHTRVLPSARVTFGAGVSSVTGPSCQAAAPTSTQSMPVVTPAVMTKTLPVSPEAGDKVTPNEDHCSEECGKEVGASWEVGLTPPSSLVGRRGPG